MIILGLTGSIGTGKTTTAAMFSEAGIPVNDADRVVHELYAGEAVELVEAAFPGSTSNGKVDRTKLSAQLAEEPGRFKALEAIVHPLVRSREKKFVEHHRDAGTPLIILDIPLLYETGATERVDKVVVVTCDEDIQKQRVMERPGMTEAKFILLKSRQMPDAEKRARADFIIETGKGLDHARQAVRMIVDQLTRQAEQGISNA